MDPSILWQNASSTVILIDIPRSLEAAQHLSSTLSHPSSQCPSSRRRRILSTLPIARPFPSLEPKTPKARANFNARLGPSSINDLLLRKHVEFALKEIREEYDGDWCLGRVIEKNVSLLNLAEDSSSKRKRKRTKTAGSARPDENGRSDGDIDLEASDLSHPYPQHQLQHQDLELEVLDPDGLFFTNPHPTIISLHIKRSDEEKPSKVHVPPQSTLLSGPLSTTLHHFLSSSPDKDFTLITLDPPWPNRSARRSSAYNLARNGESIYDLLSGLPVGEKLGEDGVVAVWITNRGGFREMVLGCEVEEGREGAGGGERGGGGGGGGLFEQWGIQLMEEWVWVKTTVKGEPICALEGGWRKPWEVLLIGRRKNGNGEGGNGNETRRGEVKRRIIAGVPDLHSRKPNVRGLFERLLLQDQNGGLRGGLVDGELREKRYEALEIFARNLTAGWWSWGDEVLKFQAEECWADEEEGKGDDGSE